VKYLIDLSGLIDIETFHEYVSKKLDFPAYYGQNFDAFGDCLLDMDSNSKIRIEGLADLRENLPDAYDKLLECINDYREEYGQIKFTLCEDSPSGEGLING
tara:strand:+ start:147 stop:449 length:303 start_codon:yes stop_codon:yes gene_type:complete